MLMLVPYLEQCVKLSNLAVPQVEHISHLSLHHLLGTLQTLTHAKKSVILQPVVGLGCVPLQWRHDERDGISNHQHHDCLLNRLYRRRSKKTSKLRVTGLCVGDSPVTGEFPAPRASNAEKVSIWWRHYDWGWSFATTWSGHGQLLGVGGTCALDWMALTKVTSVLTLTKLTRLVLPSIWFGHSAGALSD